MSTIGAESSALIDERILWLDGEIEAVLAAQSPLRLYDMARYHLGWLDEQLHPLSSEERRRHGGKRLRGVLSILACEAVGGHGIAAAPAGAAIELIHNFSLVHDDVEDNDEERRHRPTVWKNWGVPHAINVGSSMQALVNAATLRLHDTGLGDHAVAQAFRIISHAILRMTEGQYLDMAAEDAETGSLADYFQMTGGKTAALLDAALRVGAVLGTESESRAEALGRFGYAFGLAFQARDDYLGIWGEPQLTGKPVGSDIVQGKRSLPVVHALEKTQPSEPLGMRLRQGLRERDVPAVLEVFQSLETRPFVTGVVERYTREALDALERAETRSPYGAAIREIALYALGRES